MSRRLPTYFGQTIQIALLYSIRRVIVIILFVNILRSLYDVYFHLICKQKHFEPHCCPNTIRTAWKIFKKKNAPFNDEDGRHLARVNQYTDVTILNLVEITKMYRNLS